MQGGLPELEVGHGSLTGVVLWHGRERLKVHAAVRKRDVAIRDLSGEIQLGVIREKFSRVDGSFSLFQLHVLEVQVFEGFLIFA